MNRESFAALIERYGFDEACQRDRVENAARQLAGRLARSQHDMNTYNLGCRCEVCRGARRDYDRRRRAHAR